MKDFINELQDLLKEHDGIALRKIADKCHVSFMTIHNIKNGKADNITLFTYNKIKKGLKNVK